MRLSYFLLVFLVQLKQTAAKMNTIAIESLDVVTAPHKELEDQAAKAKASGKFFDGRVRFGTKVVMPLAYALVILLLPLAFILAATSTLLAHAAHIVSEKE